MIRSIIILLLSNVICTQDIDVDLHIQNVLNGDIQDAEIALPEYVKEYPNHPGVMYLHALLESNGETARDQFLEIYKHHQTSDYADDAVMKIAEYYYVSGLYVQSAEWLKRIALYYSRSEHIDRAVKLYLNSLIVSGNKDTALYYAKVFKRQFPNMNVDAKMTELLNEHDKIQPNNNSEPEVSNSEEEKSMPVMERIQGILDKVKSEITAPLSDGKYSLQIGAYGNQSNANNQRDNLSSAGYDARVDKLKTKNKTLFAVRIGNYEDKTTAKNAKLELKSVLDIDSIVIENK